MKRPLTVALLSIALLALTTASALGPQAAVSQGPAAKSHVVIRIVA